MQIPHMLTKIRSVLVVAHAPNYGGTEKYTFNLVNEFVRRGISVVLVTSDGPFVRHMPPEATVYVMPIDRNPLIRWCAESKIKNIALEHEVDIIHAQCRNSLSCCASVGKSLGIPVISHEHHSMYTPEDYPRVIEDLNTNADMILTIAPHIRETLISHGLKRSRVAALRPGIDIRQFPKASARERAEARTNLGIGSDDRVALCISRLVRDKGILELVYGFERVRGEIPNAKLFIVGDDESGKCLPRLKDAVITCGLKDSVFIHSGTFDIRPYHAAADVFCYPAISKGLSVMEAMAAGLPIVGKKTLSEPLVVEDGVHGLTTGDAVLPDMDPADIADKLISLLSRPRDAQRMGVAARKRIEDEFSIESHVNHVLRMYDEVLQEKMRDVLGHTFNSMVKLKSNSSALQR